MPSSKSQIQKAMRQEARMLGQDVAAMKQVTKRLRLLLDRDSNCGRAAAYCESSLVLMEEAVRMHEAERQSAQVSAKTGRI